VEFGGEDNHVHLLEQQQTLYEGPQQDAFGVVLSILPLKPLKGEVSRTFR
jgi:hypothetical protein